MSSRNTALCECRKVELLVVRSRQQSNRQTGVLTVIGQGWLLESRFWLFSVEIYPSRKCLSLRLGRLKEGMVLVGEMQE